MKLVKELELERNLIFYKANKQYIRYLITKIKLWKLGVSHKWKL